MGAGNAGELEAQRQQHDRDHRVGQQPDDPSGEQRQLRLGGVDQHGEGNDGDGGSRDRGQHRAQRAAPMPGRCGHPDEEGGDVDGEEGDTGEIEGFLAELERDDGQTEVADVAVHRHQHQRCGDGAAATERPARGPAQPGEHRRGHQEHDDHAGHDVAAELRSRQHLEDERRSEEEVGDAGERLRIDLQPPAEGEPERHDQEDRRQDVDKDRKQLAHEAGRLGAQAQVPPLDLARRRAR